MARTGGEDLVVKAVEDVAELRREFAEFSRENREFSRQLVELVSVHVKQTDSHVRRIDGRLAGLGTVLGAIAREGREIKASLREHDERLRKLEDAADA